MQGAQISLSIGLVGVFLSLIIGIVLGGISGYYGGRIDFAIQRVIEFVLALPTIPIWLALSAALPQDWPATLPILHDHPHPVADRLGAARAGRARAVPVAADRGVRHGGPSRRLHREGRIIFRHMLPSFTSHIIASITLAIPAMILAETRSPSSASACSHRPSRGACCCARRRTSARSPPRPGCSRPALRS